MKNTWLKITKAIKSNVLNILFFAIIIIFLFSPAAKSWLLKQLLHVGLFKVELHDRVVKNTLPGNTSFFFSDASGKITSTDYLKGKVILINFWASWCSPCRAEMSSLNELYLKFQNDNRFVFLFINEDDDTSKANKYLKDNQLSIPFYNSLGNVPASLFTGTLPTTVVINKEGRIVLKHDGLGGYNNNEFIGQLQQLL